MRVEARPNDLSAWWMPFTANRQFKASPRLLARADGMWFRDVEGREILDGTAGLWCVNAGHRRTSIADAIARQLDEMDYAPPFQMGHAPAFELASRLAALMPDGLDHAFFCGSGSEAVDTALKIALAYHRARGEGTRTRLIGRERGYHGVGFGGISVGGMVANRRSFGPLLPGVDHLRHTFLSEQHRFCRGQPEQGAELADDLERLVQLHDASTIAAVIVEPMAGSTGVLIPPKGYLERLRAICDRHGILLIFDEVITAFGRLGAASAAELLGVTPDLLTTAKALTNGVVPMGAVLAHRRVHDALMQGPESAIELFHGYTYSAHPVACAAALATLDLYRDERLFERAAALAPQWEAALHALADAPHVRSIRTWGLVAGIELEPANAGPGTRAHQVYLDCFRRGLLVRVTGDTLAFSPPLILEAEHMTRICDTVRTALESVQ
jgi:beta-alanine--pyruvate transaminase